MPRFPLILQRLLRGVEVHSAAITDHIQQEVEHHENQQLRKLKQEKIALKTDIKIVYDRRKGRSQNSTLGCKSSKVRA